MCCHKIDWKTRAQTVMEREREREKWREREREMKRENETDQQTENIHAYGNGKCLHKYGKTQTQSRDESRQRTSISRFFSRSLRFYHESGGPRNTGKTSLCTLRSLYSTQLMIWGYTTHHFEYNVSTIYFLRPC